MVKHQNVGIPQELVKQVKKEIALNNELGYRSHSEFIIDATRRRLEEVRKLRKG